MLRNFFQHNILPSLLIGENIVFCIDEFSHFTPERSLNTNLAVSVLTYYSTLFLNEGQGTDDNSDIDWLKILFKQAVGFRNSYQK